ncbi:MAG: ferritin family protein [Candidatus Marinimicrobia bacterium]|nr:ferritin family protein [Candidatus Neomarinimicrobiota bacterium]
MYYNVREIIEYAIKIEKESYAFYNNAEKKVNDNEVKKLLILLANEEINHQNNLKVLIDENRVTKDELNKKMDLDNTLLKKIVGTSEISSNADLLEILTIALEREKNTENIYAMLSTLSNIDEDIIDIFSNLKLQENSHVKKIQSRINKLK